MDFRFGMDPRLILFTMCLVITSSQSQSNSTSGSYQLSRKPCQVKGQEGTCMFVWECVKSEGTPLGMCMERFMFGSCCTHNKTNSLVPNTSPSSTSTSVPTNQSMPVLSTVGQPSSGSILTALITSRPLTAWSTDSTSQSTTAVISSTNKDSMLHGASGSPSGMDTLPITSSEHNTTSIPSVTTASPTLSFAETSTMAINNEIVVTQPPASQSTTNPHPLPLDPLTTIHTQTVPTATPVHLAASDSETITSSTSPSIDSTTTSPNLTTDYVQETFDFISSTVPTVGFSSIPAEVDSAAIPTSAIDLSDSLAIFNEINTTADVPDTIILPPKQPLPSSHAQVTTGVSFSTTQPTVPTSPSTTTTTVSTTTTASTTAKPVTSAIVVTTSSSIVKPSINISNILGNVNKNDSNSTKKPTLAVTSLPSSYPNIECGIPPLLNNRQEGRIVGGSNSKFGSWPWQVSVRRTSFFGFSSTHRCGGALLNELWVITAGHCVEDLLISQIRLRMGEYDFSSVAEPYPFVERGVNKKIVHPKYNFFTYEYDLALVRLEEPITFQPNIAPICLPATDESLIGQNGTVTGWGRLSEGGTLPSMLQQVTVPIVSNDKCKDMFLKAGRHEYIPDIFMCAGFEEGGRDSCQGDSGGPLQIRGRDGRYFLGGIISWGIGCAEANLPGVCTRISKFTPWILENVT